uniref:AT25114p n=1 Tax=Drosophila melanogaster TaxID=7227 RepID=Q8T3Y8_DROME|nr:AT25114p [Drosophila melanogaster]
MRSSFCPTLKSCLPVGSCWHHEFFSHTTRLKCPKSGTGGNVPWNDQIRMRVEVDKGVVLQRKVAGGKAAVDELQHIVVVVDDKDGDALEMPWADGAANLDDALAIILLLINALLAILVFLPILLLFVCSLLSLCWRRLFSPTRRNPLTRSRLPFLRTFGTFTWR